MSNRIAKYDPFTPLATMPSLFDGFFSPRVNTRMAPQIEYGEEDIAITWMIPGIPQDAVDVTVSDGVLKASGKHDGYHFSNSYSLPDNANVDSISATMKNGVLKVVIPLIQPEVRQIPINGP